MSASPPRVTLAAVVPLHDSAEHLARSLGSIAAQTDPPEEVWLIDDRSADATREIAGRFARDHAGAGWRLLLSPTPGAGGTRNAGIAAATAEVICFLDADDHWLPGKCGRVRAQFAADPGLDVVAHEMDVRAADALDRPGRPTAHAAHWRSDQPALLQLYGRNSFYTSATAVSRVRLNEAGGFDPSIPRGQDWDLWLRLAAREGFRARVLPEVLAIYRQGAEGLSGDLRGRLEGVERILASHAAVVAERFGRAAQRRAFRRQMRYALQSAVKWSLRRGRPMAALWHAARWARQGIAQVVGG
ncbi:MAG: glycosyltransferase family 2 protein [Planctomycetes bacterium]|nr:glycosyltransferase family 2 protein [Planctomycetota bacterium]